jgi:hypothetical protein
LFNKLSIRLSTKVDRAIVSRGDHAVIQFFEIIAQMLDQPIARH